MDVKADIGKYLELISSQKFDTAKEVIVAYMLREAYPDVDPANVLFYPLHAYRKAGSKEVFIPKETANKVEKAQTTTSKALSVLEEISDLSALEKFGNLLPVYHTVSGTYEAIPQNLFFKTKTADGDLMSVNFTEIEEQARKFFLPFEWILGEFRLRTQIWEDDSFFDVIEPLAEVFGLAEYKHMMDAESYAMFYFLLPFAAEISQRIEWIEAAFQLIFNVEGKLELIGPKAQQIEEGQQSILGFKSNNLGQNFLLGGCFNDGICSYKINLVNIHPLEIENYLDKGNMDILVNELFATWFMPLTALNEEDELLQKVETIPTKYDFTLSNDSNFSRLGYTTRLNPEA